MSRSPRLVFGMPAYKRPDSLARTLESLLSQTFTDLAVAIVEDQPTPEVEAIVRSYGADPRLAYQPNPVRLGMVRNWRRAFAFARELHPEAEFFAWVSDHDVWHPRWAEALVAVLDDHPDCVLAFPHMMRVYPTSRRRMPGGGDTASVTSPWHRLRLATTSMTAGNLVYGLFRADALERVGVFPPVLLPDRYLLEALSLVGHFRQVDDSLWYREVAGAFSYHRQRHMLFADHAPTYCRLPPTLQHFGRLFWDFVCRGRGWPQVGRLYALGCCAGQLFWSTRRQLLHGDARWRRYWRAVATAFGWSVPRRAVPAPSITMDPSTVSDKDANRIAG